MAVTDNGGSRTTNERQTPVGRLLSSGPVGTLTRWFATRAVLERVTATLTVMTVVCIAAYGVVRPDYNWDMLAYVATALENRYEDPQALHEHAWAEITPGARESQLYKLKAGNPYNLHQWENPADFKSQLSMYRVKIAYVALMRALEPLTGLAQAAILLSVLPALGVGLLVLLWLWQRQALQGAVVAMPLLVLADYAHMTTASSPDMLLALVSLSAIMLATRGLNLAACALLVVSVLVRPDNIILVFALLIAAVLFRRRFLPILATFLAALACVLYVQKISGHPGWWPHFYFSCIEIQNSMTGFSPDFSLVEMIKGYMRGAVVALMDNDWPMLLALLVAGWALLAKAGRMSARGNALAFALVIGTLGKFASFPLPDDRFYFVFISGLIVVLVSEWKPDFSLPARLRDREGSVRSN
ncbi:MAG: hypothetical protein R3D45_15830 [Rhizobiaceae bacterium]